jgi:threonine dehydrogenase-like Zn-dependent dehydrogenase
VVDEIAFPEGLNVVQVLVKILYTTICGAQINEIQAA